MNRDELLTLAGRHSQEVWGDETGDEGAGALVLERHGIAAEDAAALGLGTVKTANATDTTEGLVAIFLQGLILGLWLTDQERN